MANIHLRRPENVPGDFYVDSTCIDCDLCRQIAPFSFTDTGDMSAVYRQPETPEQIFDAYKALVACPTASIGGPKGQGAIDAANAFPEKIDGDVYFCGYASEDSFGASSYLIRHPEGNVLVDSPRFASPLVKNIEALGGIRFLFLTHRDDIADHDQWASHFRAKRVMHSDDAGRLKNIIEHLITGTDDVPLTDDLIVIPTPGHTRGHLVLLYRNQYLFTGDHIWWSPNRKRLIASKSVSWYSWPEQLRSVERLLQHQFEWVLPGHGRRFHAPAAEMHRQLQLILEK